ncbi:MAG TPA: LysM peptidoglycan-binding domain-containing protein [Clostridia bacterium]|nr:LysM peptidoglycan-binding domain-containing protein [Clostridia bacterium]
MLIYEIKPKDTIYKISRRFGIDMDKIISDNALSQPDNLTVGQTLVLMVDNIPHTVNRSETLYSIAQSYGVTLEQLLDANPYIRRPNIINVGQIINIPVEARKRGTIDVNGYAFPNIDMNLLKITLPYLTYLSIFSYQVKPDGSLDSIDDESLIETAMQARVAPLMVISNIGEEGRFSSELANAILTDESVQDTLLNNVMEILEAKNYYGLNMDFEYIYPADGDAYDRFLMKVSKRLKDEGYTLTTALAPKISEYQRGLLYQAHRYPAHGRYADNVILMTYEWGYTYGPSMAVSPINQVKRVLDYATQEIPSKKILMGMPTYGYNWRLPFMKGSAANSLSNPEAVELAIRMGAFIEYDEKSQAPYFNYYDADTGLKHEVWFDDARSVKERLELVDIYDLGGVSYWTLNRAFPQNWLILSSMYNIRKKIRPSQA